MQVYKKHKSTFITQGEKVKNFFFREKKINLKFQKLLQLILIIVT